MRRCVFFYRKRKVEGRRKGKGRGRERKRRERRKGKGNWKWSLGVWAAETSDITSQFVWNFIRSASTSQHRHHPMPTAGVRFPAGAFAIFSVSAKASLPISLSLSPFPPLPLPSSSFPFLFLSLSFSLRPFVFFFVNESEWILVSFMPALRACIPFTTNLLWEKLHKLLNIHVKKGTRKNFHLAWWLKKKVSKKIHVRACQYGTTLSLVTSCTLISLLLSSAKLCLSKNK